MSSKIHCPHCERLRESKTISTRTGKAGSLRRRRECLTCCKRFTTTEADAKRVILVKVDSTKCVPKLSAHL